MTPFVSTDKSLIDMAWLCQRLRAEHWGWALTDEKIREIVDHQLCFGVYGWSEPEKFLMALPDAEKEELPAHQFGFAAVLTDEVSVSLLGNVVIDPAHRRQGLGTLLMRCILAHPTVKKTVCILASRDAIGFYEKLGFGPMPYHGMQHDPL